MATIENLVETTDPYRDRYFTCGPWTTEAESVAALDTLVSDGGHFTILREVRGQYLQPRLGQEDKSPRIDRILVPKESLIAAGWEHGPIGIECKRSGEKIGRPIAQILDYARATWLILPKKGLWITLQWVFLWPLNNPCGPVESILAQHRCGNATLGYGGRSLVLQSGQVLGNFYRDGSLRIGEGANGRKAGSR